MTLPPDAPPIEYDTTREAADAKALRWFVRGLIIGGTIVGALAYALPAWAGEPRMSLEGPSGECFAVVVIQNRYGTYNADETLETDHGPVTLNYDTIGGHNLIDADVVTVLALPEGVIADPMTLGIPDGEVGRVCLREWIGG